MRYALGIDIGGTLTKIALVSPRGALLDFRTLPTLAASGPRYAMEAAEEQVREMVLSRGLDYPPPDGLGIGMPGVVDYRTGRLILSGPLAWRDVSFADLAEEVLRCPAVVDTDVNAGTLADLHFGCARDASEMLYISWGTGIGAGFAAGRRLYHSRGNAMCNFGHMPADPASDRLCYCGCRGCLEIEAGGRSMVEKVRPHLGEGISPEDIARAAEAGNEQARAVLSRSAVLIARCLAGLLAFLNPDTVVLGGGVSQCFPLIEEEFHRELRLRAPSFALNGTRVLLSQFGSSAGVIGAAMLPTDRVSG